MAAGAPALPVLFSLRVPVRSPCGYRLFQAHLARLYPHLPPPYLVLMAAAADAGWRRLRRSVKLQELQADSMAAKTDYYATPMGVALSIAVRRRHEDYVLLRRLPNLVLPLFYLLVLRRARGLQIVLLYALREGEGSLEDRLARLLAPDLAEQPWARRPAGWRPWFSFSSPHSCRITRASQVAVCYALGLVNSRAHRFYHFLRLRQAGLPVSLVSVFTALEAQGLLCYPESFCPGPRMPLLAYHLARCCTSFSLRRSLALLATPRGVFCAASETPPLGLCRFNRHRAFNRYMMTFYGHNPEALVQDLLRYYLVPVSRLIQALPHLSLKPRPWDLDDILETKIGKEILSARP